MTPESRWVARLAHAGFVLVLAIVATSAYIRLGAGLPEISPDAVAAARTAHRLSASIAGLLVLVVAWLIFTRDDKQWTDIVLGAATLAVMLVLAWIGRYSGPDASAAVLVSNLAGGLALSTLLWSVAARQAVVTGGVPREPLNALACVTLGVVSVQCLTGAMTVTEFVKVGPVHHWSGLAAFALCTWLGVELARANALRITGAAIVVLAVLQVALGVSALALSLPLWLVLAHNVSAALLLAALAQAVVRGSPRCPWPGGATPERQRRQ